MKKLLKSANRYVEESDWKTIAVLKFCLLSLGVLFGTCVCEKRRKAVRIGALGLFLVTYLPLMAKLLCLVKRECCPGEIAPDEEDGAPAPDDDSDADAEAEDGE